MPQPTAALSPHLYLFDGDGDVRDLIQGPETETETLTDESPTPESEHQGNHAELTPLPTPSPSPNPLTWEEAILAPVIPVHCLELKAEVHKSKFGSGNRGRSIKYEEKWLTPNEFEAVGGKWKCKDWKRSIRSLGGKSLKYVIERGFLHPHSAFCKCKVCLEDPTSMAPIEYFVKREKSTDQSVQRSRGGSLLPASDEEARRVIQDLEEKMLTDLLTWKSLILEKKDRDQMKQGSMGRSDIKSSGSGSGYY